MIKMSQKTKVKKDSQGLYVHAGGWLARPFYGTCFKEGERVKTHHFGGSTDVGVGLDDANFRNNETFEYWNTTGVISSDKNTPSQWISGDKKFTSYEDYVEYMVGWYKEYTFDVFHTDHNKSYAKRIGRLDTKTRGELNGNANSL